MELESLKNSRKYLRGDITRSYNNLTFNVATLPGADVEKTLLRLKGLEVKLKALDEKILNLLCGADHDETVAQSEYDACVDYETKLLAVIVCYSLGLLNLVQAWLHQSTT